MDTTTAPPLLPPHHDAVVTPRSEPHDALFLVMPYLHLRDLLTFHRVCKAFRDAVSSDLLLWREIAVEPPLSWSLTDDALWELTSMADGKLTSLKLLNCWGVTDTGVQRVIDANRCIAKLYIPGCSKLTSDGVVRMMMSLVDSLKQVRLNGIPRVANEHLEVIKTLFQKKCMPQSRKMFYHEWHSQELSYDNGNPIDVDICPKCNDLGLIFDCTNDYCRSAVGEMTECRGCASCVRRCVECGGCMKVEEFPEETLCPNFICLECWLPLPKCSTCNLPYCRRHMSFLNLPSEFVCEWCLNHDDESSLSYD